MICSHRWYKVYCSPCLQLKPSLGMSMPYCSHCCANIPRESSTRAHLFIKMSFTILKYIVNKGHASFSAGIKQLMTAEDSGICCKFLAHVNREEFMSLHFVFEEPHFLFFSLFPLFNFITLFPFMLLSLKKKRECWKRPNIKNLEMVEQFKTSPFLISSSFLYLWTGVLSLWLSLLQKCFYQLSFIIKKKKPLCI